MATPIRFGNDIITITCTNAALKAIEQTFHTLIDGPSKQFRTIKAEELLKRLEGSMTLQQNFVLACLQASEGDKPKTTMKDVEALFAARFSGPKDDGSNARELEYLLKMEICDAWGQDPNRMPSLLESQEIAEIRQLEALTLAAEREAEKAKLRLRKTRAEKTLMILAGPGTEQSTKPSESNSAPESSGA
jgi:hypothetical protein